MSSIIPSPSKGAVSSVTNGNGLDLTSGTLSMGLASGLVAGAVSLIAQTFAGAKTFTSAIIASAGIQLSALWNTNGGGASDIAVKAGTTTADASVNANARLLQLVTGLGGTETRSFGFSKNGLLVGTSDNARLIINDATGASIEYGTNYCRVGGGTFAVSTTYLAVTGNSGRAAMFSGNLPMEVFGGNGTGATDVCTKVGTNTADASVNATAKLLSVRTGLGGTEVEKASIDKAGRFTGAAVNATDASSAGGVQLGGTAVVYESGSTLVVRARGSAANYNSTTPAIWLVPSGAVDADDLIVSVATSGGVHLATVNGSGRLDQSGTDSSGTPGAATINKPTGKSAIANGATSVTITNSLVAATSRVMVTWNGDHGAARAWATPAAGSFTVTLSAAASANTTFSWEVSNLL